MPDPLWLTKVSLPRLRPMLVPRSKVLRQFSAGIQDGHLLTLVSAPAGYGKTTAIRLWVQEAGRPVAWVTLEKSDNDLKQFLRYVLAALQLAREGLGQAALEAVENAQELQLVRVLGLLAHEVRDLDQPIVLVLEDYHLIEEARIDQVIEWMISQAFGNLHLVLATREDPSLPLARLRVRNQLTEIRAADLRFSLEEAEAFFSQVMGVNLSPRELKILERRTEGWVAGLQLAGLSLKVSEDPTRFIETFRGTHRHILDYLIEEVINSQPVDVQAFLRRTSILDQLSASLCEAVTGQEGGSRYLHHLESNNLFLISLDEERTWYRYHALFAELLQNQLWQADPKQVDELHGRAADWYQEHGFIQNAVEHAFHISNGSKVSQLIEAHALPMMYQGEVSTVMGWFDKLPESLVQFSPMLCICKAWSLALMQRHTTRTEEVEQALLAAEEALNLAQADEDLRHLVAGYAASIQAFIMGSPGVACERPERLIETSQKAQQLLPQDEKAIRSVNAMIIGNGYAMLADLPAAERAFQQTFEDGAIGGNFYAAIYGPINLILIALTKGQLKDALKLCETNIARFNQFAAGQRFPPIGALHILKGSVLLEENRLAEAQQELTQGLSLVRWTGEFRTHIKGYSALARLRSIQGDQAGLLECISALEETRPEAAIYAQALRQRLWVHDWAHHISLEKAHRWVTETPIRFGDLPEITGVDPVSEVYFRAYLSAAHVLTRLAVRYPQAFALRDVHDYFARQEKFAGAHDLMGWLIEIWILRALMYHVEGRAGSAHHMLRAALSASAPRGYFRIFLDEGDLLRPLLESAELRLKDQDLSAVVKRLLEAMPRTPAQVQAGLVDDDRLSDRELEVLGLLATGRSYKEIGQQLCLSLNTVQFHVKSIYRKLSVNKRVQAIEKAREKKLI